MSDNSWQVQPNPGEPGGATWHKVTDPDTGWLASKTSGWTADSFSGGLEVDFSDVVSKGTKAVRCAWLVTTTASSIYWRKSGDSNISNTPSASSEVSHRIGSINAAHAPFEFWLSADYKIQIAVTNTGSDVYIAYPVEYLL